jgi:integrase
VDLLPRLVDSWLLACDINQHSARTMEEWRGALGKFLWFLRQQDVPQCGTHEVRRFLHYLTHGHEEPGGRWGNPRMTRPVAPGTVKTYHKILRAFFNWLVAEGEITVSPMQRVPTPVDRPDQIQPFTPDQLKAVLAAAKRTLNPRRDEAIVLLLLDTGLRASELCDVRCRDVDLHAGHVTVREGKGGQEPVRPVVPRHQARPVPLPEPEGARGLRVAVPVRPRHRRGRRADPPRAAVSRPPARGRGAGGRRPLLAPHVRHTFAIEFLRAGGNVFTLQQILGHTHLAMTQRYVAVAEADVVNQHRRFSPVERLKGRSR